MPIVTTKIEIARIFRHEMRFSMPYIILLAKYSMKKPTVFGERFNQIISSNKFFWFIVGLLVFQASWIALSGRYPMAFDENYHLGVIKLYSHHISPFWEEAPPGSEPYGAITRDPSYLFHYLMSFPYRLISLFTNNLQIKVLFLRSLNLAMFVWGLILFRQLLSLTKASKLIINFSLLIFVLIPVTSLLAAQINYDNLIIPLTGLALILTVKFHRSISKNSVDLTRLLQITGLCILASLVKYAFLPIFISILLFILWQFRRNYHSFNKLKLSFKNSYLNISKVVLIVLIGVNILGLSLFIERYGINLINYHKPVVDCAEVHEFEHCKYYGPWIRDYYLIQNRPLYAETSPISFTQHWLYGMWFRSFFAVDGPATDFQTRGPLTLPGIGIIIWASLSGIALVITARKIWRKYDGQVLWLLTITSLIYIAVLWLDVYQLFLKTGKPVAINGRYLLPVLPLIILISCLAIKELTKKYKSLQVVLASLVIFSLVWGGGFLTYILRSNDNWYWQNSPLKNTNHAIQNNLGPFVPGYNYPTQYLH